MEGLSRHTRSARLGTVAYNKVFRATDNETGEQVVLKQAPADNEIPSGLLREISILRDIEHTNIVKLRDAISEAEGLTLVFESMRCDMQQFLQSIRAPMQPDLLRSYAFQLLAGVARLHAGRVVHRDIAPRNMLINRIGLLKLSGFQLARVFSVPVTALTPGVTLLWYRAPELMIGDGSYGVPADMWSAGCVIGEMARRAPLFPGDCEVDQIMRIARVCGTGGRRELADFPRVERVGFAEFLGAVDLPGEPRASRVPAPRDISPAAGLGAT